MKREYCTKKFKLQIFNVCHWAYGNVGKVAYGYLKTVIVKMSDSQIISKECAIL